MRRILASMVLVVLLFPALALGGEVKWSDLVKRDGLFYPKFSDVPFTGKTTGSYQGTFRNGKLHGLWVEYYDNGQLEWKGTHKDGKREGSWVWYYDNGQVRTKGTYKDGKQTGPWVHHYDNGQIWTKGTYKDGKDDGPWVYYHEDGTVDEEETGTYKDGFRISD